MPNTTASPVRNHKEYLTWYVYIDLASVLPNAQDYKNMRLRMDAATIELCKLVTLPADATVTSVGYDDITVALPATNYNPDQAAEVAATIRQAIPAVSPYFSKEYGGEQATLALWNSDTFAEVPFSQAI